MDTAGEGMRASISDRRFASERPDDNACAISSQ
jgi:hypothetical protein